MATKVSVQLPRKGIRPGGQAWLETSAAKSPCLGPGESLATVGVSQRALVQFRYHKHVLLFVTWRTDFAEYPLHTRPRLGLFSCIFLKKSVHFLKTASIFNLNLSDLISSQHLTRARSELVRM